MLALFLTTFWAIYAYGEERFCLYEGVNIFNLSQPQKFKLFSENPKAKRVFCEALVREYYASKTRNSIVRFWELTIINFCLSKAHMQLDINIDYCESISKNEKDLVDQKNQKEIVIHFHNKARKLLYSSREKKEIFINQIATLFFKTITNEKLSEVQILIDCLPPAFVSPYITTNKIITFLVIIFFSFITFIIYDLFFDKNK